MDLDVITAALLDQVRVLDGINRYRFGKDQEMMAEWNAARHVPSVARSSSTAAPAGDGVVPPSAGGVAPAA